MSLIEMTVHYTYPSIAKNLSKVKPQINTKIAERSIKGLRSIWFGDIAIIE